ncbi:MAG: hypothetical protein EYC70_10100 [Planctomycetota bacterium]|nr:MAG: hypothetical protein EYC70_10100 [Planctomycetota bacterium]
MRAPAFPLRCAAWLGAVLFAAAGCQMNTSRGLPGTAGAPPAAVGVPRFVVLGPGVAGGGQPAPGSFPVLKERGYSTIVSLRTEQEDRPEGAAKAARAAGLAYYEIPVAPNTLGSYTAYRLGEVLKVAPAGFVLIHDDTGDRTGALWGVYVGMEQDLQPDAAVELAYRCGMQSEELAKKVHDTLKYQPPE